jgi:dihydroneopterin aldolase
VSEVIEVRDLRVSAVVGALAEERDRPQPLSVDIDLFRPFEEAALSDDLASTTNYADVLGLVTQVATEGQFLLLETLAYRAAQELLASDPEITKVTVAVRKLRPPVPEDVATVGVRCSLERPA